MLRKPKQPTFSAFSKIIFNPKPQTSFDSEKGCLNVIDVSYAQGVGEYGYPLSYLYQRSIRIFRVLLYYFIIRKSFKKLHNPTTFTIFAPMKRKIRTYGGYFEAFMETLKEKEQEKIQYGLLLLKSQDRLPKKFVKLVRDGIYELRTEYGGNIYRVFFIFDEGEIVVLLNGFQKKTQKTPQNEIEKAIKIKEAYYADKQSQNR